ncbi:MAG: hypothetical protein ACM3YE_08600 [Bacteroidota bacterium]
MQVRKILTGLLLILVLVSGGSLLSESRKQVLIIDIPRLTFEDLNDTSYLKDFLNSGAVGLVTVPITDPVTPEKVYLGFNSGAQLKPLPEESLLILNTDEQYRQLPAGELYHSLTGYQPGKKGGVHLSLAKIIQLNPGSISQNIGRLGWRLHRNSYRTAAIGNSDADIPNRGGALLLMDEKGQVDLTALGRETLKIDPDFPFEMITDEAKILSYWQDFKKEADVIVITLGDLERLEKFGLYLSDQRWSFYRRSAMKRYDQLFGQLRPTIDSNSMLTLIFTGVPPQRKTNIGEKIMPVVINGPGFKPGIIYSHSTRKAGVITEYDLPATILKFLGIEKSGRFNGQNLESVPGDWRQVANLRPKLVRNYQIRWPLLTGYAYLLIGSLLAGVAALIFKWRPICFTALTYTYWLLLLIPVVFLIEGAFDPLSWFAVIGGTLALAAILLAAAVWTGGKDSFRILSLISFATVILIVFDGLGNGFLEAKSFLGYSMVAGARFYGIGNEYLGFLLGAYTVFLALNFKLIDNQQQKFLSAVTWLLALVVAHPNCGANIGGGSTIILGLGITNLLLLKKRINLREIAGLLVSLIALLSLVGLWDYWISKSSISHFGQLLFLIQEEGFPVIKEMIIRKWDMNWRLINYTPWSKALLGCLIVIPLLYYKPSQKIIELLRKYPDQLKGFLGLVFSAIIALVLNDSGIVAAAMMFIFGGILLLLVLFKERNKRSDYSVNVKDQN